MLLAHNIVIEWQKEHHLMQLYRNTNILIFHRQWTLNCTVLRKIKFKGLAPIQCIGIDMYVCIYKFTVFIIGK